MVGRRIYGISEYLLRRARLRYPNFFRSHLKTKSGKRYWERASISAIKNQEGLITHYVKVAEDMTELKHAQEALRESQKRVYENQKRVEILKFANEMALTLMHELRNPLVSIGGFSKRISFHMADVFREG